jgi:Fe-S-cluster-containing hydrogenase component 2
VTIPRSPLTSLQEGHWFKLICGASYHHLPAIRNLALAYTLAGVDCIDLAADPAIVAAARSGLEAARQIVKVTGPGAHRSRSIPDGPWLMVSLNDGEDPHFRKAAFDPALCPVDCDRPCERVCPAQAIVFSTDAGRSGVIDSRCYGCGRCLPICPIEQIYARSYVSTAGAIAAQLFPSVDAVEIHTQVGRTEAFGRLWQEIAPELHHLKLVAISCPDGEGVIDYLWQLWDIVSPLSVPLIWQTDGRPMSGDIGAGATTAAVRFGQKVLAAGLPGYVQLAGGTNSATVQKLRELGLLQGSTCSLGTPLANPLATVSGIAYGSYARKLLQPILDALEAQPPGSSALTNRPNFEPLEGLFDKSGLLPAFSQSEAIDSNSIDSIDLAGINADAMRLETVPTLLIEATQTAAELVGQLKGFSPLVADLLSGYSSENSLLTLPS